MEDVMANMRRDISIQVLRPTTAFHISFTYEDPLKVQAVVRELVTQFTEQHVTEARNHSNAVGGECSMMQDHKFGENLEVLEPASLPEVSVWPNRLAISAAGLAAGLLLGVTRLLILRRPFVPIRGPLSEAWMALPTRG
jgi:hypothetical protein